jgi:hypothetical protein
MEFGVNSHPQNFLSLLCCWTCFFRIVHVDYRNLRVVNISHYICILNHEAYLSELCTEFNVCNFSLFLGWMIANKKVWSVRFYLTHSFINFHLD